MRINLNYDTNIIENISIMKVSSWISLDSKLSKKCSYEQIEDTILDSNFCITYTKSNMLYKNFLYNTILTQIKNKKNMHSSINFMDKTIHQMKNKFVIVFIPIKNNGILSIFRFSIKRDITIGILFYLKAIASMAIRELLLSFPSIYNESLYIYKMSIEQSDLNKLLNSTEFNLLDYDKKINIWSYKSYLTVI